MAMAAVKMMATLGLAAGLAACSHQGPGIQVWDHPLDVRHCRKVADVSPPVRTSGNFGDALAQMAVETRARGGSDLYLRREGRDWAVVSGVAYDCGPHRAPRAYPAHKITKG